MYQAFVYGAFDIRDDAGRSVLPKGRKQIALLASLVLARHYRRTRKWLQNALWCDSLESQAAGSLRQALTVLRRHFEGMDNPLQSDAHHVWLDPAKITVVAEHAPGATLLEGIEVGCDAFEDWLREIRGSPVELAAPAYVAGSSPGPLRAGIAILPVEADHATPGATAQATSLVEQVISELFAVGVFEIFDQRARPGASAPGELVLGTSVSDAFGRTEFFLTLRERHNDRVVWRGSCELAGDSHAADTCIAHQLITELNNVLIRRALNASEDNMRFAHNVAYLLQGLFKPRTVAVPELLGRLDECFSIDRNSAILYALRSTVSALQIGEHILPEKLSRSSVEADVQQTLDLCQTNGIALALASHAEGFFLRNKDFSLELSRKAIASNPANPLCWSLHAAALARCGQHAAAQRAAVHSTEIGRLGPMRSYLYSVACACAVLNGRHDDAIHFGEKAYQQNTRFLAPMKYLVVAHTTKGNYNRANELAHAARDLDGRFGLEALLDPSYFIGLDAGRARMIEAARTLQLH